MSAPSVGVPTNLFGLAIVLVVGCSSSSSEEENGGGMSTSTGGALDESGGAAAGGKISSAGGALVGGAVSGDHATGGAGFAGAAGRGQSSGGTNATGTSAGGQMVGGAPISGGAAPVAGAYGGNPGTSGGQLGWGGVPVSGGTLGLGGRSVGGARDDGGSAGSSGANDSGATAGSVGVSEGGSSSGSAGANDAGGRAGSSGTNDSGGNPGSAGTTVVSRPCDIYQSADTPCAAAHSTVRALYGSYTGNLYQVRRVSDGATQDIGVLDPGGFADSAAQDSFCSGEACTISVIYDQSPNGNHLTQSPPGGWLNNGGLEADAFAAPIRVGGHSVYGVYTTMNWDDDVGAVGYRNNQTQGVATGDEPEVMYMVVSGRHYNQWCCFDYGNAETNNLDNGDATMEAVYFGSSTQWAVGNGEGPWVLADLENGVFHGNDPNAVTATNTPIDADYVTAMLKGPAGDRFVLKGGDAQSGPLATKYDGPRPAGYSPMLKEGAIILGTGGDNSHTGEGTFFEGCMTTGVPSDDVDDAVQANIIEAGYGH